LLLQSILNNPGLKTQQIKVDVNNGAVKLSGSVQSSAQKAAAESAAQAITNVRDVD
jgi:osmotically-inducible protein OsmY